jgi:hypothetical protein
VALLNPLDSPVRLTFPGFEMEVRPSVVLAALDDEQKNALTIIVFDALDENVRVEGRIDLHIGARAIVDAICGNEGTR